MSLYRKHSAQNLKCIQQIYASYPSNEMSLLRLEFVYGDLSILPKKKLCYTFSYCVKKNISMFIFTYSYNTVNKLL